MQKKNISIVAAAALIAGFLFSQDALAGLAWRKYHSPATALVFAARDEKLLMSLGNYYFNGGAYDLARAKKAYEKALRQDSKILWGHYQLARIYFVEGKYDRSIDEINKELEANPENLRSLYVRGLIYGYRNKAGDLKKAEEDFRRFTKWAPKEWAGYNDLAWILSKESKYREAKDALLLAFQNVPGIEKNPWLWNSLGVAELNLGEIGIAQQSFQKALIYAEELTIQDWHKAYPGNNPAFGASGLSAFISAIRANIEKADSVDK